jgi:hypothetical protein
MSAFAPTTSAAASASATAPGWQKLGCPNRLTLRCGALLRLRMSMGGSRNQADFVNCSLALRPFDGLGRWEAPPPMSDGSSHRRRLAESPGSSRYVLGAETFDGLSTRQARSSLAG